MRGGPGIHRKQFSHHHRPFAADLEPAAGRHHARLPLRDRGRRTRDRTSRHARSARPSPSQFRHRRRPNPYTRRSLERRRRSRIRPRSCRRDADPPRPRDERLAHRADRIFGRRRAAIKGARPDIGNHRLALTPLRPGCRRSRPGNSWRAPRTPSAARRPCPRCRISRTCAVISTAADLARRLARDAEAVCRHYLSKGRRSGRYWIVGDVQNTPGRSLYVRLSGPDYGPGAAGHWTDAASGEHGDLLDLIALNRDLPRLTEAMDEARLFLAQPRPAISRPIRPARAQAIAGSPKLPAACSMPAIPVPGHARGSLSARPWHHGSARLARAALSSVGLLPRRRGVRDSSNGPPCSPPSPRRTAPSPAFSAPGSTAYVRPRLRLPIPVVRSVICSATRSASAPHPTPRRRRRHRDDAGAQIGPAGSAHGGRFVRQPPRRVSTCPASCAASMLPATTIRPVSRRSNGCANAIPTSMSASSCRCTPISTTISAPSALTQCGHGLPISSIPPTACGISSIAVHLCPAEFGCSAGRKKGGGCGGAVPWPERCRASGLPSGDRPEAPGGGSFLRREPPP